MRMPRSFLALTLLLPAVVSAQTPQDSTPKPVAVAQSISPRNVFSIPARPIAVVTNTSITNGDLNDIQPALKYALSSYAEYLTPDLQVYIDGGKTPRRFGSLRNIQPTQVERAILYDRDQGYMGRPMLILILRN